MYQNYLKIAWRNLSRYKMYSFIKIGGFALGIAACMLIALYIQDELSYDTHYPDTDRIYRLINILESPEERSKWPAFSPAIKAVLENEYPDIEKVGRLIPYDWYDAGGNQVRPEGDDKNVYDEGFMYADQELLEMLQIPMVHGSREEALAQPRTIVLSKRKADKYFPGENPVGKTFILNENEDAPYTIGGVIEDFPSTSHLQADFLITLTGEEFWEGEQSSWCCSNYNPYILLKPGADYKQVEQKLLSIRDDHILPYLQEQKDQGADEIQKYYRIMLQPIEDIHLRSGDIHTVVPRGDITYVWLFGAIACVILLLGCINFINLSTAKSANRAKEVGLRKVIGSFRSNLVNQFLTESFLYSALSFASGLLLARLLLPYFNTLADKSLTIPWGEWWLIPLLLGCIGLIGTMAGLYPALYLSGFKPIEVLKGNLSRGSKSATLRSTLVVFQFVTSIILIIGAFVVQRQMDFILNKKLGYDREQVIMIDGTNTLGDQLKPFKNELARLSEIQGVTVSNYFPISKTKRDQNSFWLAGREKIDKSVGAQKWRVDEDYISTMGMRLVAGRNFSTEIASDSQAVIINQLMAKRLGLKEPLGKRISNSFEAPFHIIGVVENFHFESMKGEIGELVLANGGFGSIAAVKVHSDNMKSTIASIEGVWNTFLPNQTFRYTFLDERYAQMYDQVKRTGQIFSSFALLAIAVACLGLFALSAFMAEQRRKEISIRKVLGASFQNLFGLLTLNFMKLVGISLLIAVPLGGYLMQEWLSDFAYRADLSWEIFLAAGVIMLLISLATVSYESIRVVRKNPIDSLQSE